MWRCVEVDAKRRTCLFRSPDDAAVDKRVGKNQRTGSEREKRRCLARGSGKKGTGHPIEKRIVAYGFYVTGAGYNGPADKMAEYA